MSGFFSLWLVGVPLVILRIAFFFFLLVAATGAQKNYAILGHPDDLLFRLLLGLFIIKPTVDRDGNVPTNNNNNTLSGTMWPLKPQNSRVISGLNATQPSPNPQSPFNGAHSGHGNLVYHFFAFLCSSLLRRISYFLLLSSFPSMPTRIIVARDR